MKKLLFILLAAAMVAACKKSNPSPQTTTITKTDTVSKIVYTTITKVDTVKLVDTVDCIPLSDIVEGTWYNYAYERSGVVTQTSVTQLNFTDTSFTWQTVESNVPITISSDYSTIYFNSGPNKGNIAYNVINGCSTLSLTQPSNPGTIYLLRRNH